MSGFATLPRGTVPISQTLLLSFVGSLRFLSAACGTGSTKMPSTAIPPVSAPAQPNFPSIPPEPITWPFQNPAQSSLPAPPAADENTAPWKNGANDFPLTVASPMANATVTSPVNMVVNATPKIQRSSCECTWINSRYISPSTTPVGNRAERYSPWDLGERDRSAPLAAELLSLR